MTVSAGSSSGPGSPAGNTDPPPQTSATIRSSGPGPATASNSAANAAGPAVSGTRMGRFRNADTGGWAGMAIARDRHTLKRAFPKPPERCGKLRRTISRADHQGKPPGPCREVRGQGPFGACCGGGGIGRRGLDSAVSRRHSATSTTNTPSTAPSSPGTTRAGRFVSSVFQAGITRRHIAEIKQEQIIEPRTTGASTDTFPKRRKSGITSIGPARAARSQLGPSSVSCDVPARKRSATICRIILPSFAERTRACVSRERRKAPRPDRAKRQQGFLPAPRSPFRAPRLRRH